MGVNAPSSTTDHVAYGDPEPFREFVAENFGLAIIHLQQAIIYAEVGDDAGLEYAARRATAYFKCALSTLRDLKEAKASKAIGEEFA
jgi:hypothetical protein